MEKEYLTVIEVSEYLGIKAATLYNKVESGEIPHYRIGKLIRFKKREIDLWMEGQRRGFAHLKIKADDILKSITRKDLDIEKIAKKSVDEISSKRYTPDHGRPDQKVKGLESKEV